MKKTILVIYTDVKVNDLVYNKRYAFNTESDVKEGDMLNSPNYSTKMQVVKVLDKSFKYFNKVTGELSDDYTNSNQFETRDLVIINAEQSAIIATKLS
jgi:hypothetical protein